MLKSSRMGLAPAGFSFWLMLIPKVVKLSVSHGALGRLLEFEVLLPSPG